TAAGDRHPVALEPHPGDLTEGSALDLADAFEDGLWLGRRCSRLDLEWAAVEQLAHAFLSLCGRCRSRSRSHWRLDSGRAHPTRDQLEHRAGGCHSFTRQSAT